MCTAAESTTPKIHQLFNSNFLPSGNLRSPASPSAPRPTLRRGLWLREERVSHKGSAPLLFLSSVLLSIQNGIRDYAFSSSIFASRLKNKLHPLAQWARLHDSRVWTDSHLARGSP
jgi:hypothetical protein